MKQFIMILLAVSVPVMFFLSVYQVYQYQQLESEIAQLKEVQIELFESNKRRIANIAILSSPKRIAELASQELELEQKEPSSKVLRIVLGNKEKPDG